METALPRSKRKVPKPLMEKRRRERINHSLETLRRVLLENTRNERLSNPKVEKAEILESVVEFLRTEHDGEHPSMKRALSPTLSPTLPSTLSPTLSSTLSSSQSLSTEGAEESTCKRRKSYHEGMRACLLRVSHFISTKTQELEDTGSEPLTVPAAQGQFCQSATISSSQDPEVKAEQHVFQQQPPPQGAVFQQQPPPQSAVFQHSQSKAPGLCWPPQRTAVRPSAGHTELSDPVWRPWPQ